MKRRWIRASLRRPAARGKRREREREKKSKKAMERDEKKDKRAEEEEALPARSLAVSAMVVLVCIARRAEKEERWNCRGISEAICTGSLIYKSVSRSRALVWLHGSSAW